MASPFAFVRLMRPVNCMMMGFAVVVGAALASGLSFQFSGWQPLLLSFFTPFVLTGSAMAVNDYFDREIDAINEPRRPIPSGAVSPREALIFFSMLTFLGLLGAFLTNLYCFLTAVLAWAVMVLYSAKGKRTGFLGNLLVSTCVSVPFVYGAIALKGSLPQSSLLFAFIAFLSNTGREVTKGIVDIEGDSKEEIKTIAVLYGSRFAAIFATVLNFTAVLLSLLPWFWGLVSILYFLPISICDSGFVFSSVWLLMNPSRGNAKRIKNLALIWMGFGLIGFLVGTLH